jgi:competence protein ComEC
VPLTSVVVMPAGMIAVALMPFGLDGPALWVMGQGVEATLWVARVVAAWPEAAPVLPPIPGPALAVATLGFCWLALWRGRLRLAGLPVVVGALAAGMLARPPDLLVSPDARLVALRTADGVFLQEQAGASAFARDVLLRRMGVAAARPLPIGGAADGALSCGATACTLRGEGGEIVLLRSTAPPRGTRRGDPLDAAALAAACGGAALIVAAEPIRPRCVAGATVDRFTVWREGGQAAWLDAGGLRLVSDRAWRGERPWVAPVPLPGQPDPQPQAPRDGS